MDYPCVIDERITAELSPLEQAYFTNTDAFIFYRGNKIIVANWETEEAFNSLEEFKKFSREALKALCENYTNGIISLEDFYELLSV